MAIGGAEGIGISYYGNKNFVYPIFIENSRKVRFAHLSLDIQRSIVKMHLNYNFVSLPFSEITFFCSESQNGHSELPFVEK